MNIMDEENKQGSENTRHSGPEKRRFVLTGLVLLGAGVALILDRMGYVIPDWVISWQMLLIGIGIYIGEKHRFSNPSFLIPIVVGLVFLSRDLYPNLAFQQYFWPGIIIIAGLVMIFRPRRVWNRRHFRERMEKYNRGERYQDRPPGKLCRRGYGR